MSLLRAGFTSRSHCRCHIALKNILEFRILGRCGRGALGDDGLYKEMGELIDLCKRILDRPWVHAHDNLCLAQGTLVGMRATKCWRGVGCGFCRHWRWGGVWHVRPASASRPGLLG